MEAKLFDILFNRLVDRLERWQLVNVGLEAALLAVVGQPPLVGFIGAVALMLRGLQGAALMLRDLKTAGHPFDVALH